MTKNSAGRGIGRLNSPSRQTQTVDEIYDFQIKANLAMNFNYYGNKLAGVTAENTFDAILRGERIATTRWGLSELNRLDGIESGDVISFTDKDGRVVLVRVRGTESFDPATMSEHDFKRWAKREGWSIEWAKKEFAKRGTGLQVSYVMMGEKKPPPFRISEKTRSLMGDRLNLDYLNEPSLSGQMRKLSTLIDRLDVLRHKSKKQNKKVITTPTKADIEFHAKESKRLAEYGYTYTLEDAVKDRAKRGAKAPKIQGAELRFYAREARRLAEFGARYGAGETAKQASYLMGRYQRIRTILSSGGYDTTASGRLGAVASSAGRYSTESPAKKLQRDTAAQWKSGKRDPTNLKRKSAAQKASESEEKRSRAQSDAIAKANAKTLKKRPKRGDD